MYIYNPLNPQLWTVSPMFQIYVQQPLGSILFLFNEWLIWRQNRHSLETFPGHILIHLHFQQHSDFPLWNDSCPQHLQFVFGKIYSVLKSELDSDCSNAVNNSLFARVIGKNKWASTLVEINQYMVVFQSQSLGKKSAFKLHWPIRTKPRTCVCNFLFMLQFLSSPPVVIFLSQKLLIIML